MVEFTAEQNEALDRIDAFLEAPAVEKPWFTLQGLAGTGKTTVLAEVARRYPDALPATFTGKAASVLGRKIGRPASTIHAAIYQLIGTTERSDGSGKLDLRWERAIKDNAWHGEILLLDEVSMLDGSISEDLLRTGARIIAVGDPGQLPPVSGEQFFHTADFTLRQIHRQAWDSGIIRQAHGVREHGTYVDDRPDVWVLRGVEGETICAADVMICWKNTTRIALNRLKRQWLGLSGPPRAGETVVCLMNNADHGLYNGATYELAEDYRPMETRADGLPGNPHKQVISVWVDGAIERIGGTFFEDVDDTGQRWTREITPFGFGYAMTCHKVQGSEYEKVLLYDEYSRSDGRQQWLYTGITRASKVCAIVRPWG